MSLDIISMQECAVYRCSGMSFVIAQREVLQAISGPCRHSANNSKQAHSLPFHQAHNKDMIITNHMSAHTL